MDNEVREMLFYYNYMAKLYPDKYKPFIPPKGVRIGSTRWWREFRRWQKENGLKRTKRRKALPPETRRAVLDRDGHKCFFCGATENLEVHHLLPRSQGGGDVLENLLTVCTKCHAWVHEGDPVHCLMMKRLRQLA